MKICLHLQIHRHENISKYPSAEIVPCLVAPGPNLAPSLVKNKHICRQTSLHMQIYLHASIFIYALTFALQTYLHMNIFTYANIPAHAGANLHCIYIYMQMYLQMQIYSHFKDTYIARPFKFQI